MYFVYSFLNNFTGLVLTASHTLIPEVTAAIVNRSRTAHNSESRPTPELILKIISINNRVRANPAKQPSNAEIMKMRKKLLLMRTKICFGAAPTTFRKAISFIFFRVASETSANRPVAISRILITPNQEKMVAMLAVVS